MTHLLAIDTSTWSVMDWTGALGLVGGMICFAAVSIWRTATFKAITDGLGRNVRQLTRLYRNHSKANKKCHRSLAASIEKSNREMGERIEEVNSRLQEWCKQTVRHEEQLRHLERGENE